MKPRWHLWFAVAGLVVLAACTSSRPPAASDGQTHWMRQCRSDAQCGSLECLCGVCAVSCDDDAQCHGALGESAACVIAKESVREARCSADAPAGGLCLPLCDGDADCEAIDARLVCEDSVCYSSSTPPPPAPDGAVPDASPAPPSFDASPPPQSFDASVADASDLPGPDGGDLEPHDGSVVPDASVEIVRSLENGELFCADLLRGATIEGLRVVHATSIRDFEIQGSDLYYTIWRYDGASGVNAIRRVDGSGEDVEIVSAPRAVEALELEGDDLVWVESNGLSVEIHSRVIAGGPILDLGPPSAPYANVWGLVADPDDIFWFTDGMVLRSDRTPRATMPVASDVTTANASTNMLLADETYLYYLEGEYPDGPRTIHRVPKDGSAAPSDFVSGAMPFRFVIASDYLYFSEPGVRDEFGNHDGNGRIVRRELEGTDLETIVMAEVESLALAVDETNVYWLEADASLQGAELWRAPKDGSGQPQRLLTSDLNPWAEGLKMLKLTADEIYWVASCATGGGSSDDFLLGMAKP